MFNNIDDLEDKLDTIFNVFQNYELKMEKYSRNSKIMSQGFLDLFESMIENRENYLTERQIVFNSSFISRKIYDFRRKKSSY